MSNNKKRVDLHMHTTASDGRLSPGEVVKRAKKIGLSAIAITDHDTVKGIEEAVREGEKLGVEVIPGIELTCRSGYREFHVLGYFLDYKSEKFVNSLKSIRFYKARESLSLKDFISIIIDAGGIPVLAHPEEYYLSNTELKKTIQELKSYGLAGIEVMHPSTSRSLESVLRAIAVENDLCITGGSDFHGKGYSSYELGSMNVKYDALSALKEKQSLGRMAL